uniref:Rap-GAP domain-containing protein n=1 Tax=Anisakis simplex TaxID=6269 RepID=A0A0M3KCI8_ANISI
LCAYHDCQSLAAAWGLGPPTTSIEPRPTGASQAQSPCEDDSGDGKCNDLLVSCPAFRNELGGEPIRRLALTRRHSQVAGSDLVKSEYESWQREQTAAESAILEDVSNVYLGGRLCAARQPKIVIEPQDIGSYYYRHCFVGRREFNRDFDWFLFCPELLKTHSNYLGTDDTFGPVALSMIRENVEHKKSNGVHSMAIYRMIVRISDVRSFSLNAFSFSLFQKVPFHTNIRELYLFSLKHFHINYLAPTKFSFRTLSLEQWFSKKNYYRVIRGISAHNSADVNFCYYDVNSLKFSCLNHYRKYIPIVRWPFWSATEHFQILENGSPAFEEFLDFLGQRVRLKGFDQYKGGLDIRGDTTGTYSIYAEYQAHEIMFHVSTLLPFTHSNRQQLARKRHIGNDMVTLIFQEPGALPFSPITVRSHFQHVFIIVRANHPCTDDVTYTYVSISLVLKPHLCEQSS